ncbi:hypothetical protein HAX54_023929 [Datura stramonium]|uniref:Uncharacterized protein n=1 Tax=Datura stramonium TaxID=4076 RepID=A0ABS8UZM6_DATST|nr:hypothetical protein [Datura stramonium]
MFVSNDEDDCTVVVVMVGVNGIKSNGGDDTVTMSDVVGVVPTVSTSGTSNGMCMERWLVVDNGSDGCNSRGVSGVTVTVNRVMTNHNQERLIGGWLVKEKTNRDHKGARRITCQTLYEIANENCVLNDQTGLCSAVTKKAQV